jgi:hypothetical protein
MGTASGRRSVVVLSRRALPGALRASSSSTVRPQMRPWQMPRPARVLSLSERSPQDPVADAVLRNCP